MVGPDSPPEISRTGDPSGPSTGWAGRALIERKFDRSPSSFQSDEGERFCSEVFQGATGASGEPGAGDGLQGAETGVDIYPGPHVGFRIGTEVAGQCIDDAVHKPSVPPAAAGKGIGVLGRDLLAEQQCFLAVVVLAGEGQQDSACKATR